MGYLDKAVETMQQQRGRGINFDMIEYTLLEIDRQYKPGLIRWLKSQSDRWARLLQLEDRINKAALAREEVALREALEAYRLFFQEIMKIYGEGETLPLF